MRLVIQLIHCQWTRASRGAPGATLRNAVPEHLPVPAEILTSPECWQHEVSFAESSNFAPHARLTQLPSDFRSTAGLALERNDDGVLCRFVWGPGIGAPEREARTAFNLRPQQSGRLCFNGRLSLDAHSDRGWQYQKFVYNIAWVDDCAPDIFEDVDHEFSSMEFLR